MIGGLRLMLSRIAAITVATMVAALSAVRGAFAASTSTSLSPEYTEMLRLAEEKVQAATQPGAFGNGVPLLYDGLDPTAMLPWVGVAATVAVAAICAAILIIKKVESRALIAQ